jgi:hypothetical protein
MIKFENKTNGRFYYLSLQKDILNDLVLTIIRGGRNSQRVLNVNYNCLDAITNELQRLIKRRLKRGYTLV